MYYLALPILSESNNLTAFLDCLSSQTSDDFELYVCVNNYESWWLDDNKQSQCEDNQKSIGLLQNENRFKISIIDKSSPGKGWLEKRGGVGHARKVILDSISKIADDKDVIICMDADTFYPKEHLVSVGETLENNSLMGVAIPYYHKCDGRNDRLILRYEIYMRYYLLNMLRIKNPYAFTAIGSAMAFPVWAYKKSGGMKPVQSGEDFYFLQKLAKTGKIGIWSNTIAYPSSRFSDRVNFGTGPALIKGNQGDWDSYPIYPSSSFDEIEKTFNNFPELFKGHKKSPMDEFLQRHFKTDDIWSPIRDNYKDEDNFIRACINKVDGLRILQYLKSVSRNEDDNLNLINYINMYLIKEADDQLKASITKFSFEFSSLEDLIVVRDFLFEQEMRQREDYSK